MTENTINISEFDKPILFKHRDIYWLTPSKLIRHKTYLSIGKASLITDKGWFAQRTIRDTIYITQKWDTYTSERNTQHPENKYPMHVNPVKSD